MRARAGDRDNLTFEVADGSDLPLEDGAAEAVFLHTVLTHVTGPGELIAEARRILKPGGQLVVCDADFSKATLSAFANDPLDVCARLFVQEFVTDAHLVAKLPSLMAGAGLDVEHFDLRSRVVASSEQMMPWVAATTELLVNRGQIGSQLADALVAEYRRRMKDGSLYGYQAFATCVARKPA